MGCTTGSAVVLPHGAAGIKAFLEMFKSMGAETHERITTRCISIIEECQLGKKVSQGASCYSPYSLRSTSAWKVDQLAVKVADLQEPAHKCVGNLQVDHDTGRNSDRERHLLEVFQNHGHMIELRGHGVDLRIHDSLMEKCEYGCKPALAHMTVNEAFHECVFHQMHEALVVVYQWSVVSTHTGPDNFLLSKDLTVKHFDFGLVHHLLNT